MPQAIPMIVGAAVSGLATNAVIFGVTISAFGAAVIGGVASALTAAVLTPKQSGPQFDAGLLGSGGGRTQQVRQPISAHQVIYGRVKTSGPLLFVHTTVDDDDRENGYIYLVHGLAGHQCLAIGDIYLGEDRSSDAKFTGFVRVGKHLGAAAQTADSDFIAELGAAWTTNHRLRGRCYIATRLKYDADAFPTGLPNVSAIVDGVNEIADPRDASTGWSDNPALCIAHWMQAAFGMRLAATELDEASVIAAANVCDERVLVTTSTTTFSADDTANTITPAAGARVLRLGDGVRVSSSGTLPGGLAAATTYYAIPALDGTLQLAASVAGAKAGTAIDITSAGSGTHTLTYYDVPRYRLNGQFTLDAAKRDILQRMLTAMAGVAVYIGGKWYLHAGAATTPTVTLDEDDLRGPMVTVPKRSMRDRFNGVRAVYVSPDQKWQPIDAPPLQSATYLAEDAAEELYQDIRLPFSVCTPTVQRLMKIELERNRRQMTVQFPAKLTAMRLQPWDGVYVTNERYGWTQKQFRVIGWALAEDGGVDLALQEDDSNVYAWTSAEERLLNAPQSATVPNPSSISAPAAVSVTTPTTPEYATLEATWTEVPSIWLDGYDAEYRADGATPWTGYGRTATARIVVERSTPQDFQVRAVTKNGATSAFTQNLAPDAPTSPSATGGAAKIDLAWTNGSGSATVQIFENSTNDFASSSLLTTVAGTAYSHTGLGPSETHYYWLRSKNSGGNISLHTSQVNATTDP